jgi:hypothetical protein
VPQPVLPLSGEFIIVPLLLFSKSNTVVVPEYDVGFEKSQYNILPSEGGVEVGVGVGVGVTVFVGVGVLVGVGVISKKRVYVEL